MTDYTLSVDVAHHLQSSPGVGLESGTSGKEDADNKESTEVTSTVIQVPKAPIIRQGYLSQI